MGSMRLIPALVPALREVLRTRDLSTGLLKRDAFESTVEAWVGGGDARRPATTLLMVQVATPGQQPSDAMDRKLVLALAEEINAMLRATDVVGHVDDDTLGVLLPSTPVDQGERAAERLLERLREADIVRERGLVPTIGAAGAGTLEPWLAALQALRSARIAGGGRVLVAPER